MNKTANVTGELALIEQIRADSAAWKSRFVTLGIGDDCAILQPRQGSEILVTTDLCLEGRHFRRDWHSAESAGHRCLARGLSDLAAMGAEPMAAFLSLALPLGTKQLWIDGFFRGLRTLGDRVGVQLAGGDTAQAPGEQILADIVLVGAAARGKALRRNVAKAGEVLYVTGMLGGAAAELERMQTGQLRRTRSGSAEEHPQMFPEPRLAVGKALLRRGLATACMDLSDGLSTDIRHLCRESGVGAEISVGKLPINGQATLRQALEGGEDYELLFAAPADLKMPRRIAGVAVTAIGRMIPGKDVVLVDEYGERSPSMAGGWEHLRG